MEHIFFWNSICLKRTLEAKENKNSLAAQRSQTGPPQRLVSGLGRKERILWSKPFGFPCPELAPTCRGGGAE